MRRAFFLQTLLVAGILVGVIGVEPVLGQNNRFTERSFLSSPAVLGMGDAGVALPGRARVFFYNPAHLPAAPSSFTVFGLQASASPSLDNHVRFLNRRVPSSFGEGDELSSSAAARLQRRGNALAQRPSRAGGGILLPSFVYSPGAFAIGGGVFTKTALNYRLERSATSVPSAWLLSRTDLMALVSVGLDLRVFGLSGLSVGVTGTQTRRFLAFEHKSLSQFGKPLSPVRLEGGTFQLDVGATYAPRWLAPLPGTLRFGGAVYDVLAHGYGYGVGGAGRLPFLDAISADSVEVRSSAADRARRLFTLSPSYRAGMSYQLPSLLFLEEVAAAVDYQGYGTHFAPSLARVHAGVRATVAGPLRIRGGLSSGYPTGGIGLELGALRLDYAYHGFEEGKQLRQLRSSAHTLRLLLRLE